MITMLCNPVEQCVMNDLGLYQMLNALRGVPYLISFVMKVWRHFTQR